MQPLDEAQLSAAFRRLGKYGRAEWDIMVTDQSDADVMVVRVVVSSPLLLNPCCDWPRRSRGPSLLR
jgi:hypothetical protein